MKILNWPRQMGKTTALIKYAAKTKCYIVCANRQRVQLIVEHAKKLELDIRFPVTFEELKKMKDHSWPDTRLVIDELEDFLRDAAGNCKVMAVTTTSEDIELGDEL